MDKSSVFIDEFKAHYTRFIVFLTGDIPGWITGKVKKRFKKDYGIYLEPGKKTQENTKALRNNVKFLLIRLVFQWFLNKNKKPVFDVPDDYFEDFFDFLSSYTFSLDESDEKHITPSILEKIYESLLENTKENGAYYTPKEVVSYMNSEVLIAYLNDGKCGSYEDIENFIKSYTLDGLSKTNQKAILQKLKEVKICDPCVGCGAFPLEMLKRLALCRQALGDKGPLIHDIIKNNIYGADIDKGAVRITKMRLRLSLYNEAKTDDIKSNIVCGDSLMPSLWNTKFDIVIGNPPYVSTKGVTTEDKEIYKNEFGFSDDTYNLFYFKGLELTKIGGSLTYITPKTFWTTQTKRNMRDLILSKKIRYIFDTGNPFESAMVDTSIIQVINKKYNKDHVIRFVDGCKDLSKPIVYPLVKQEVYLNTQNAAIFKPSEYNMKIWKQYGKITKELYDEWWDKIKSSENIAKNKKELEKYRKSLNPGDVALLGCLTEGGQGLATANNGKYIAVRSSTKWAAKIRKSRPKKLQEAIKINNISLPKLSKYSSIEEFLKSLSEPEIGCLFDKLKEKYGRDIFGRGYIYKIIDDNEIADVNRLSDNEKENGIAATKKFYVPYDKGDKDGNRWYLETPFAIAWTKENVRFLKSNSGKKGKGMPVVRNQQFYFREGICWSDINTTYIKCRAKSKTIHDVKSMSLFSVTASTPEFYLISLINSSFMSHYVDDYVNNTQTFQINDARQIPIIIPDKKQLADISEIFGEAMNLLSGRTRKNQGVEERLAQIQTRLDAYVLKIYGLE